MASEWSASHPRWSVYIIGPLLLLLVLPTTVPSEGKNGLTGPAPKELNRLWTWGHKDPYNVEMLETLQEIMSKYDPLVRPPQEYVNVSVVVFMAKLKYLDTQRQEMQVVVGTKMSWNDRRLIWTPRAHVSQLMQTTKTVWTPDIVFFNSVAPSQQLLPNQLRIRNDGTVFWTRKEVVTTSCNLDPSVKHHRCLLNLGFMSNIDEPQMDRYIQSDNSTVIYKRVGASKHLAWKTRKGSYTFRRDKSRKLPNEMVISLRWQTKGNSLIRGGKA